MRLIDADDLKNKELEKFGCDPTYYYGHPIFREAAQLVGAAYAIEELMQDKSDHSNERDAKD